MQDPGLLESDGALKIFIITGDKMKSISVLFLLWGFSALAAGGAKHGGVVTEVAPYKAELTRSRDSVRLYLYDQNMKPINLKGFEKKANAQLTAQHKGKAKEMTFPLDMKGKSFQGPLPSAPAKPYTIRVQLKENGKELTAVFENLN